MKMYAFSLPFIVAAYHWLMAQKVSDLLADWQFLRAARMEVIRRQQALLAAQNQPPPTPPVA